MILKILSIFVAVICLTAIIMLLFDIADYDGNIEIVDCYDKAGNKIIGQQCIETGYIRTRVMCIVGFAIVGLILTLSLWSGDNSVHCFV